MTALLRVDNLAKSYGALAVISDLSLEIEAGELHAIIGPNGAGKTTLVSLLSGQIPADRGEIRFDGSPVDSLSMPQRSRLGICRSFQIISILPALSVIDNVAICVQSRSGSSFRLFRNVSHETQLFERARQILDDVGLFTGLDRPARALSHGERRQLEIAMALACSPKLLLLDEPLAGTSGPEAKRLMELIGGLKRKVTIILIEHDIGAVFSLADRISVLVYGRIIATGSGETIRSNPEVRQAYLGEET
jgi:branched-chain amino acid transport system ATP-binding protein